MCGICGVVDLGGGPIDADTALRMRQVLAHRGPDGEGQVTLETTGGPSAYLGHRRLKVIDLSEAAAQPLANETGTVLVSYNGEIYNFQELASDLEAKGHIFRSRTDTEVIVHGYEEYGDEVVERLDGMFAFGLWDASRRRLLLARDRTGKKPLYYHFDGRRLSFASEIKGLLVCSWVDREVDAERIPEYLCLGYVSAPRTLFKGIAQLPPAHCLTLEAEGKPQQRCYWRMQFADDPGDLTLESACQGVRERLTSAVAKRLISDVPLGAFLSGGIDSSIVVGLMSQLMSEPVKTFTIGFADDSSYDERGPARLVADHFNAVHTDFVVRPNAAELLEKLLWHHDQPYGDSSAIPTYVVSRLAKEHVTVALVGDGGDEVFAGYERFLAADLASRVPKVIQTLGLAGSRLLPRGSGYFNLRRRVQRFCEGAGLTVEERYREWTSIFPRSELETVLHEDVWRKNGVPDPHQTHATILADTQSSLLLNRLLKLNFETYLPEDLLVKADRASMANALETRSPLLDRALVEFASSIPPGWKLSGRRLKFVLKKAFEDMLPKAILRRPKHGFGIPIGSWFQKDLGVMYRELVLEPNARSEQYIDKGAAMRMLLDHSRGLENHGQRLWVLLNLEIWLRQLEVPVSLQPPKVNVDVHARQQVPKP